MILRQASIFRGDCMYCSYICTLESLNQEMYSICKGFCMSEPEKKYSTAYQ
jgi:hypothetical protein